MYLYICHFPNLKKKKICIQFCKISLLELVMNEQAIQILLSSVADSADMDMVCVFDLLKELYERPCSWQKTSLAVRMPQAEPLSFHWHGYSSHLICNEAVLDDSESLWPWLLTGRALASWREVPYALSFGSKIRHVGEKSGAHKPFLHITLYTHYSHTHTHLFTSVPTYTFSSSLDF